MEQISAILKLQLFIFYFIALKMFQYSQKIYRLVFDLHVIPSGKIRLCSIVYKQKRDVEEIARNEDFLTIHNQFIDIDFLNDPKWTIYCVEKDFVFFVLLPKHIKEYNAQRCPFMYFDLFNDAMMVAEVPMNLFKTFGNALGDKEQPMTILYTNTARCGSTLLAKMLHNEGYSQCFAESYALANISTGLSEGIFLEEEVRSLLPPVINVLRAHISSNTVVILKTESTGAQLVPYCSNVVNMEHIFSFRKNGLSSVERVVKREEMTVLLCAFYLRFPKFCNFLFGYLTGAEGKHIRNLHPDTPKKIAAILYASPYAVYLKHKEKFLMDCIWFTDIINNTEEILKEIFRKIGIPETCIPAACEWKNHDSQGGTFLSKEKLAHIQVTPLSESDKKDLEMYANVIGVPVDTFYE